MKGLRKWSYLLLLTGAGIIYLTCVDKWHIYGESLAKAEEWYAVSRPGAEDSPENGSPAGQSQGKGNTEGGSPAGQVQGEGNPEGDSSAGQSQEEGNPEGSSSAGQLEGEENPEGSSGGQPEGEGNPESGSHAGQLRGEENPEGGTSAGQPEENGESVSPEGTAPESGEIGGEPVYMTVEDDYFSDAVFIGDSRTVGLSEYAGLEETAAFYASTGLTVYKMFDAEIVSVPGKRKKISVEEALSSNSFAKIYLMIGINEMGTGTVESFLAKYQEAVEHLQELQPEAMIYLQAIIKVSTERSQQGDYINNEGIVARNDGIAQLADNVKVFYLDVNPLICDETGGLTPSYTFDGVHLKAQYISIWKDYLKSHAILLD